MKRFILVDGNSLMYRAYYGMSANTNLTTNSKGVYTNATYGFIRMMGALVNQKYDNILVAFDAGKETLRHAWMADYKAGRPPMPDEFRMQIAYIKEYLDLMRIKRHEQKLYEADDIIGTMSKKAEELGYHVDIYSSDKDLLQLISENTTVHLNRKGMSELDDYTPESFYEKYGIKYTQFVDLKAIMGDKSDNLAGIPGVGEKTGVKLLNEYNDLEGIIQNMDNIKGAMGQKIKDNYENARLCKKMATIIRDFDIELNFEDTKRQEPDYDNLRKFYTELEFKSLLKEMTQEKVVPTDLKYEIINDFSNVDKILINDSAYIFETFEYNYHKSPILAIGVKNNLGSFIIDPNNISNDNLKKILENDNIKKSIFDYKRAYVLCKRYNTELRGVDFDLLLATYILSPQAVKDDFKGVASYYDYDDVYFDEQIYGKGAKKAIPDKNIIYEHVIKKANALYELKNKAIEKLEENKQLSLLTDIEIPLSKVLGKMEFNGMLIDKAELYKQKAELEEAINNIAKDIYQIVGHEFNISSPKQLGAVLFEELNIPYPKKKGSTYSTDIEVLESIKKFNPVVEKVIDYRAKTKLYSTYVAGLLDFIYPDGKVHTIFEQALTNTGRLSSIEPNLQNIPIRTPEGHMIRKMFVPTNPNNSIYSADYSQIELRVLAHMANVKGLKEAFNNGIDIHTKTAMDVFHKTEITKEDRRKAKAVNFGIIYGISAFGLAQDIDISNYEAKQFIDNYYEAYPEIKKYMDDTIEFCKQTGYVKTLKNRIRYIPEINSKIYMQREFAKRMAMNAPIQGSAADIMKIAMVNVDKKMEELNLKSKILVQVHDEMVFEVEKGEEEVLQKLVRQEMTSAVKLDVILEVGDSFGKNWYEVK